MRFRSVWFDCDSTLATIEGIDELATLRDAATLAEIAELTNAAMDGERPLSEVYEQRLGLLAPSRAECELIGQRYIDTALPDAALLIEALHCLGKRVGVVSGGLLPPVLRLTRHLGIDDSMVQAVGVDFDADGNYRGFDRACPLWRNGGKIDVLGARPEAERPLCFVGDGITDLEAAPVVERFIGFGGVARRPKVEAEAEFYTAEPRLAALLDFVLDEDERRELHRSSRFRPLLAE